MGPFLFTSAKPEKGILLQINFLKVSVLSQLALSQGFQNDMQQNIELNLHIIYLQSIYFLSMSKKKRMFHLKKKIWNTLFSEIYTCEVLYQNASID